MVTGLALVAQEKCTRQHAAIADRKLKFRSNQLKEDQFTAGIATKSTRPIADLTFEEKAGLRAEATHRTNK